MQSLRVGAGQVGHLFDRIREGVQGGFRLGLGGFHHDGLGDDQREVDRGRVVTPLQQSLGHIQGLDAMLGQVDGRSHELVHAGTVVGQVEHALQPAAQVVGGQHSVLGGLGQAVAAHGQDVGVGAHQHPEVAVKAAHPADRLRPLLVELVVAVTALDRGLRQERLQVTLGAVVVELGAGGMDHLRHLQDLALEQA